MTKDKKLEIWKKDADDNGFTCENCAHSRQDIINMLIYNCYCTQTNMCHSKNYFCAWFEPNKMEGQK